MSLIQDEDENRVICITTYPGDEFLGLSSKLEEVDVFFHIFGRGPYKAKAQNSQDSIVLIVSDYYQGLPPYRVGILMNEALESLVKKGDTVYVPSVFEPDKYRREMGRSLQVLLTRRHYDFNIIDYSIDGIQPKAQRVKIVNDEREELAKDKYGSPVRLSFKPFEEFSKRNTEQ